MSTFAWCVEGRCEGTKPVYSRPCPGKIGNRECDCGCHKASKPRFSRRKGAQLEDEPGNSV